MIRRLGRRRRSADAETEPAELGPDDETAADEVAETAGESSDDEVRSEAAADDDLDEEVEEELEEEPVPPPRPQGPWDEEDVPDDAERFDLGGIRLLVPDGAQVQLEVAPDGLVLPTVIVGEGGLQVTAFAAPRRSGIWRETRHDLAESLRANGGAAEEADGPFGPELHAQVPVQLPDGQVAAQPVRFVGVDGPRWFLRGVLTGAAALDPAAAAPLEEAFRGVVVVRGKDAMAPGDPLPVQVPREVLEAAGVPPEAAAGFDPFERGPEITEVR